MVRVGIIGTGSMGGMLIRKFIETGAFKAGDIMASNRTPEKAGAIAAQTGIRAGKDNRDVAMHSDVIFLCVKPLDVKGVLKELKGLLTEDRLIVSIAGDVFIKDLSAHCDSRIVRVIPSVASEISRGILLVAFDEKATNADRELILSAFGRIGKPVVVKEREFEICAQLTSCAPAYIASLMQEFALAAARRDDISPELAELLVKETLAGTAELLISVKGFDEVVTRVATKGGITEEGVKVIKRAMPATYDEILDVTLAKHELVKEKIRDQK
jgi:pyrroline-5-carboxylate reductase